MTVSRRLGALFLLALGGVLFMLGAVLGRVAGTAAVVVYAVVVVVLLLVGAGAARRQVRRASLAAGRTCTCCTSTVHDPVQVV